MMHPRSSSRGRNTSASVTVTVTVAKHCKLTDMTIYRLSGDEHPRSVAGLYAQECGTLCLLHKRDTIT